jgi:hypothetical protein
MAHESRWFVDNCSATEQYVDEYLQILAALRRRTNADENVKIAVPLKRRATNSHVATRTEVSGRLGE